MKRSAPISFFGMREAKNVDSVSLKLSREPLASPPPPPAPPIAEQGIALSIPMLLLLSLGLVALLSFLVLMMSERNDECSESRDVGKYGNWNKTTGHCILFVYFLPKINEQGWFGNLGLRWLR